MGSSNKSFGIVFGIFFSILLAYSFYKNQSLNIYYLIFALLFFILGFLNSRILTPLNKAWIKFGELGHGYCTCSNGFCLFFSYFSNNYSSKIIWERSTRVKN